MKISDKIKIHRNALAKPTHFFNVFEGFETLKEVKRTFGKDTQKVLSKLIIKPNYKWHYMWIDDKKGRLVINPKYLKDGPFISIYLDTIHELVHIRQHMQGKQLFHDTDYLEWPTEIEAYKSCVREGKRLGMSKKQIREYLRMAWPKEQEKWDRFYKRMRLT
jgi:hypothetical protein